MGRLGSASMDDRPYTFSRTDITILFGSNYYSIAAPVVL